jgi:hypothetical protein
VPPDATIGSWPEAQLAKYIREAVASLTPDHIPGLTVDDLIVAGSLNVKGTSTFNRKLVNVGGSGAPPFTNAWVNLAGFAPAAFWKDANGIVTIEGLIATGTLGTTAFTLPPGYRPDRSRAFPAYSNATLGLVLVTSAGLVQPQTVGTASNASYSLDAIRFRTGKT